MKTFIHTSIDRTINPHFCSFLAVTYLETKPLLVAYFHLYICFYFVPLLAQTAISGVKRHGRRTANDLFMPCR